ncbi:MAG TPA: hypothetical protein VLQ91_09480 [Draconibacterium sp.]|nr:hypothetical protein [Draconibacterium sp.]
MNSQDPLAEANGNKKNQKLILLDEANGNKEKKKPEIKVVMENIYCRRF